MSALHVPAWERFQLLVGQGAGVSDHARSCGAREATARDREYLSGLVEHHRVNTIPFLIDHCDLKGKSVLEFGAGTAGLSVAMIQAGVRRVTGVEPNRMSCEAGRWRSRAHGLEDRIHLLHVPDTSALPFAGELFDACVCSSVLQYVPDTAQRARLLIEMHRVVKPGGLIIVCASGNGLYPMGAHNARWWVSLAPRRAARLGYTRGVTYWETDRALSPLGAALVRPATRTGTELHRWHRRARGRGIAGPRLAAHYAIFSALALFDATLCRAAGTPIEAFMPFVALAYQKDARMRACSSSIRARVTSCSRR